ncbi:MAG: hypothetical protein IIX11_06150, partial [Selenomonadales bacterium]|nr:hypothetical protein [Selenomonadales bacterium]
MTLGALYDFAAQQNIPILPFPLPKTRSMSVMDSEGSCFVGLDPKIADGGIQERVHLSHELGHC